MSLEAFFEGMAICGELEKRRVAGVSEICPANASYLVRFDPDVVRPETMLKTLKEIEARSAPPISSCRRASSRSRCSTMIPGRMRP